MSNISAAIPNNQANNQKAEEKKPLSGLMNQSTIYRRHQARLLKNMEKPVDPRPKAVRVLAGLPGFRTFILPYDEKTMGQCQPQSAVASSATSIIPGASNFAADETVFQASQPTTHDNNDKGAAQSPTTGWGATPAIHSMLTAGVLAAVAEACYGATVVPTKTPTGDASPFRQASLASMASERATVPLVHEHANLSFFRLHAAFSSSPALMNTSSPANTAGAATKAQLLSGASTAAVLFGTKVLTESYLTKSSKGMDTTNNNNSIASVASSAVAGATVALVSLIQPNAQAQLLRNPMTSLLATSSSLSNRLMQQQFLTRHIVGATVYFSSYEMMKSFLASNNDTSPTMNTTTSKQLNTITVALSGAVAGALYQGSLLYKTNSLTLQQLSSPQQAHVARRLAPFMLRVAPAHALLFVGYEWAQGNNN